MRYLGCKTKLLNNINEVIKKYNYTGNTFADLFSGTGCVGDYFKDKYNVISNDFMYYSFSKEIFNERLEKLKNMIK